MSTRIVWSSFSGRFSDNPRALWERLHDRPGLEHVWLLDPAHAAAFPSDVDTVEIDGPDARPTLESADLVVASTHIEVEWTKAPSTRYLQTWHGTPLKRIHNDALIVPDGRLALLDRDVARWDVLLSPNAASTPRLQKAFGFDGPVWETGYPRNDLLVSPEAPAARAAVRRELGLAEDVRVVLYAPTWRDDERYSERRDVPLRAGRRVLRLAPRRRARARRADPAARHDDRPVDPARRTRGHRRLVAPRRARAAAGRGRAGHRLLVADVRLRAHRAADRPARLRPGALPRPHPRALLRPALRRLRVRSPAPRTSWSRPCCPPRRRGRRTTPSEGPTATWRTGTPRTGCWSGSASREHRPG